MPMRIFIQCLLAAFALHFLSACSSVTAVSASAVKAQRVAEGVYAFIGTGGEITAANQGRIGNAGFIIGSKGVLVIDSGVSHAHGQAMLDAIRETTQQPVRVVLLTHAMQEFLFGATAYQAAGAELWMHAKSAELMKQRCGNCLKQLNAALGEASMRGSRVPTPEREFVDVSLTAQQLGERIGRDIKLLHYGHSSGPGDVAVWDVKTLTLFSGAMVASSRLPDTRDAKLGSWLNALNELMKLRADRLVTAHGPVADEVMVMLTRNYLSRLDVAVKKLVDDGVSLTDASNMLPMRDYAFWDQFNTIHGPNIHRSYLEHERRLFDSAARE